MWEEASMRRNERWGLHVNSVVTCKITPLLVKDGSNSLFSLDGRRTLVLSVSDWVVDIGLHNCDSVPCRAMEILFLSTFFRVFPLGFRHVGQRHEGISSVAA